MFLDTNSDPLAIHDLEVFLKCAENVTQDGAKDALDATRNLLSVAIIALSNSRYRLKDVLVESSDGYGQHVQLESSLNSICTESRKTTRVVVPRLQNNLSSMAIKEEPMEEDNVDVIQLKRPKCFICHAFNGEAVVTKSMDALSEHMSSHLRDNAFQCEWCASSCELNADYDVTEAANRLFLHLIESHPDLFHCPSFVQSFSCSCNSVFFSEKALMAHRSLCTWNPVASTSRAKRSYESSDESDFQAEGDASSSSSDSSESEVDYAPPKKRVQKSPRSSREMLTMTKFYCFLCNDNKRYADIKDLSRHVNYKHIETDHRHAFLSCPTCSKKYRNVKGRLCDSSISETLARLLHHVVFHHSEPVPSYVQLLNCSYCKFSSFSPYLLERHTSSKHNKKPIKSEKQPPKRKKQKIQTTEMEDRLLAPVSTYEPYSEGASVSGERYAALIDRKLLMAENKCFCCNDTQFETYDLLISHWEDKHAEMKSVKCCHCQYSLRCLPSNAMWVLLDHINYTHAKLFPTYVQRVECPLKNCSKSFLTPSLFIDHLLEHDILSSEQLLKTGTFHILCQDGSNLKFTSYKCYLCNDDVDHLSIISFINHWYEHHLTDLKDYSVEEDTLSAKFFMHMITEHASNMVSDGKLEMPDYITNFALEEITETERRPIEKLVKQTKIGKFLSKFQPLSAGIDKAGDPIIEKMNDRCLAMTEPRCFICNKVTKDQTTLKSHYLENHVEVSDNLWKFNCNQPDCSYSARLRKGKMCMYGFTELLARWCTHVQTHPGVEIPSSAIYLECPIRGCSTIAFCIKYLCSHLMHSHHIFSSNSLIKNGQYIVHKSPEILKLSSYKCFECNDGVDYNSIVIYINHWLQHHFSIEGSLQCRHCGMTTQLMSKLAAPQIMTSVMEYADHLFTDHNFERPDYICTDPHDDQDDYEYMTEEVLKCLKRSLPANPVIASSDSETEESFFAAFSQGTSTNPPDIAVGMQERQITFKKLKCLSCDSKEFLNTKAYMDHVSDHFTAKGDHYIIKCHTCGQAYKLKKHKYVQSNVYEILSLLCAHMLRKHEDPVPDFVASITCCWPSCGEVFLNLYQYRSHLRKHDIITSLTGIQKGEFIITNNTLLDFISYECFLCDDHVDYKDVLSYILHWISKHVQLGPVNASFSCPKCPYSHNSPCTKASNVMESIVNLLQHMSSAHEFSIDSYATEASTSAAKTSDDIVTKEAEEPLYHKPISNSTSELLPVTTDKKMQMNPYLCIFCTDGIVYNDVHSYIAHYSMHLINGAIHCSLCNCKWPMDLTQDEAMETLTQIAMHFHRFHSQAIPQHVMRFQCPLTHCSEILLSTHALSVHASSHNLVPFIAEDEWTWAIPALPTHPIFSQYICFACTTQADHGSLMGFLSHWLWEHFMLYSDILQFSCSLCPQHFEVECKSMQMLRLSGVMAAIGSYLSHLEEKHGLTLPSYVQLQSPTAPLMTVEDRVKLIPQLHNHQVTMRRLICFQCPSEDKEYTSRKSFLDHWVKSHLECNKKTMLVRCKYCNATYSTKITDRLGASKLFSALTAYCDHLQKKHNERLDNILSSCCPIYGCEYPVYSLDTLSSHMKSHGWDNSTPQELRSGEIPILKQYSVIQFKKLQCYLCHDLDESSDVTAMEFLNHFIKEHFQVEADPVNYTLKCQSCFYVAVSISKVNLHTFWQGIHLLLIHCIHRHNLPIPDFIVPFFCKLQNCSYKAISKNGLESHKRAHDTTQSEFSIENLRKLSYNVRKCFLCPDQLAQYPSDSELSEHWQNQHMRVDRGNMQLPCNQCETTINASDPTNTLSHVSELFMHQIQKHAIQVPDYISQMMCMKDGCQYITFVPEDLMHHEEEMHPSDMPLVDDTQEAEEETRESSLYALKPLEVTILENKCCLCLDGVVYEDYTALINHIHDVHFTGKGKSLSLPCSFCYKKYSLQSRAKSNSIVSQALSSLIVHMVERHEHVPPPYIQRISCIKDGCDFQTFTTNRLASHLKLIHNIIDPKLGRFKAKSFKSKSVQLTQLTSKLVMKMTRYVCFECEDSPEFTTYQELSIHLRDNHFILDNDVFRLKCRVCSHEYKVNKRKGVEPSPILESISFYFMHLVNKHNLVVPDYVIPYYCPLPDCTFVTFTLYSVETHCKQRHKSDHARLVSQKETHGQMYRLQYPSAAQATTVSHELLSLADPLHLASFEVAPVPTTGFMCLKCGQNFETLELKDKHMETHARKKQYLCHVCPESFGTEESCVDHMLCKHQVARGEEAYFCHKCDFATNFKVKLQRHLFKKHNCKTIEDCNVAQVSGANE